MKTFWRSSLIGLWVLGWVVPAHAQWITQVNSLKAGWNAVYLHVDASQTSLTKLVGNDASNPIQEVWQWQPVPATGQFTESPSLPTAAGTQWASWTRAAGAASSLQLLRGNSAYLVRVANNTAAYQWRVTGKPLAPANRWTLTGLNFIGFPTPAGSAPTFDSFLAPAPEALRGAEIYAYGGLQLNANNPFRVTALRTTPVARDQAYWVRAGDTYNQYFGPFQITVQSAEGIRFRRSLGQAQLRLKNLVNAPLTVSLRQLASEPAPGDAEFVWGDPALLVRGKLNATNLTYGYTRLDLNPAAAPQQWALAPARPGSEVEVVLGLDRYSMEAAGAAPGDLWAGVLRFTDSLNLAQVDVAVSAEAASTAGLWVGSAAVDQVSHYLKPYAKAASQADLDALLERLGLAEAADGYHYELDKTTGRVLVFGGPQNKKGSYLLDGPIKIDPGTVARPFPMRLIVHNTGTAASLLQHVYSGIGLATNPVVTTQQSQLLPAQLASARRASAVHLPVSTGNVPWPFTGTMKAGGTLKTTVELAYDDQASNPFLHTYHPDHDNLDALFQPYANGQGIESYGVSRQITLTFRPPADDFQSLTTGGQDLTGNYAEAVTFRAKGAQTKQFNALGSFALKRVSDIATLVQ